MSTKSTLMIPVLLTLAGSAAAQDCPNPDPSELRPVPVRNDVYRLFHVSNCWVETDFIETYIMDASGITNASQDPGARRRDVYCPIIEDDLLSNEPGSQYTQVTLNGYDGSLEDTVLATVCIADPTSMLTECGADVMSGRNAGWGTAPADGIEECWLLDEWAFDLNLDIPAHTSGYYSFVAVSLPPFERGTVTGYEVSRCDNPEGCTTPYCVGDCPDA